VVDSRGIRRVSSNLLFMNTTSQSIAAMNIEELQSRCLQLEEQYRWLEQQNAELTAKLNWFEALKALPEDKRNKAVAARVGLEFCNQLFAIERDLKDATPQERYQARQVRSRPVLDAFRAWLKTQKTQVLPKSSFGQAVNYCLNQWDKLIAFLQDGRLELDNNWSERSIKPFVIGRKNWLFANTPRGARASAITYSIIETAKENGLNPFQYLSYLFEKLPNLDPTDGNALDQLLPWSDSLPPVCRASK